jgi:hypothetical protein
MKQLSDRILKVFAILAVLATSIPVTIMPLRIKASNLGNTQEERVAIFYTYLPEFLHGRWNSTYLSIAFCTLAIVLSLKSMSLSCRWWKALNLLVLAVSGALLFLNVFSMM